MVVWFGQSCLRPLRSCENSLFAFLSSRERVAGRQNRHVRFCQGASEGRRLDEAITTAAAGRQASWQLSWVRREHQRNNKLHRTGELRPWLQELRSSYALVVLWEYRSRIDNLPRRHALGSCCTKCHTASRSAYYSCTTQKYSNGVVAAASDRALRQF